MIKMRFAFTTALVAAMVSIPTYVRAGPYGDHGMIRGKRAGPIAAMSGGIGDAEQAAIEDVAPGFALEIILAENGRYLADIPVSIVDADGTEVLNVRTQGPFLLANLPDGRYRVTARDGASSMSREIDVTRGHHEKLVFDWRPGAGASTTFGPLSPRRRRGHLDSEAHGPAPSKMLMRRGPDDQAGDHFLAVFAVAGRFGFTGVARHSFCRSESSLSHRRDHADFRDDSGNDRVLRPVGRTKTACRHLWPHVAMTSRRPYREIAC